MSPEEDEKAQPNPKQGEGDSATGNDAPAGRPEPGKQDGVADPTE